MQTPDKARLHERREGGADGLRLTLGASPLLAVILVAGHGGVMAVLLVLDLHSSLQIVLCAALAVNLGVHLRRSVLRGEARSVVALRVGRDELLFLKTRSGDEIECDPLPATFVSAVITVLTVRTRPARRRLNVIICCDCVDAEDFRRLRIWLRWRAGALSAEQP